MKIVHFASEVQKKELTGSAANSELIFINAFEEFVSAEADVHIDWQFENNPERVDKLHRISGTVVVNAVIDSLEKISSRRNFVRINGWPGFLSSPLKEISAMENATALRLMEVMNWKGRVVQDIPGFITPRIISTIINEAYFTLEAGVSTKEEIDIAMKLGTNYPYGPFEWSKKIGIKNILNLLHTLQIENPRYQPCEALKKEASDI